MSFLEKEDEFYNAQNFLYTVLSLISLMCVLYKPKSDTKYISVSVLVDCVVISV